jgi:hypothetical protein
MGWRVELIVLQALGALSIVPYPAILVANVMSMAAEGPKGKERWLAVLPFLLLSLYPLVWIALYAWSWRAMSHGATGWAFGLSSAPVVLSVAGAVVFSRL